MAIMAHNINQKPGYKQTEVGMIPEDWEPTPLGLLSAFITKGATPTTYGFSWVNDGILFLRSECVSEQGLDLTQSMFITSEAHNILKRGEIRAGDILITITGNVGRVIYLNPDFGIANINQHIARIRIVDSNVAADYVYHFLSQAMIRKYYNSIVTGQAYPQISLKQVRDTRVPIPPTKSEQTAIATALSDTDSLITLLDHLITKKRNIKQAMMQQLLTGKMRLPGFSKGLKTAYKQTEIGLIPEDWDIKQLRDVCISITDGTHYTPKYVEDGIPFYSVENITADNFSDTKFISTREHNDLIRRCKPEKGDILLTRIGSLGYTKLVNWNVNASIYVSLALLKMNNQRILTEYMYAYTKANQFVKDVEKRSLMNATPIKINMGQIGNIPIPCPPLPEQQAIATVLSDMDAEIAALEHKREKTHMLKQGMMQELLTGKTRLI